MVCRTSIWLSFLVGILFSLSISVPSMAQEFPEDLPGQVSPEDLNSHESQQDKMAPNVSSMRIGTPSSLNKRYQGWWQVQTSLLTRDEGTDQAFASVVTAQTNFDVKLAPMLAMRLSPGATFFSSQFQQRIDNDDYESQFYIGDSFLQIVPVSFLEFRVGSLSQQFIGNNQLVAENRAFPGLMEIGHVDFDSETHLDITAEQVVPTSRSLDVDREGKEPMPFFHTQSASFRFEPQEGFGGKLNAGHFTWLSLPSKVAYDSELLGNQPTCQSEACSFFNYSFEGFFAGGAVTWSKSQLFGITAGINHVSNTDAPYGRGNAEDWRLEPFIDRKFYRAALAIDYFFSETDVTPARYTSARFGNNNREGMAFTAKIHFKKYDFSVYGQYVSANPIVSDSNQFHLTSAILGVETDYASF